ncbi:hypothetical protein D6827_03625, partial [Candidatus Parcubacteria bacterium]
MSNIDLKISYFLQDRCRFFLEFWWIVSAWGLYIYAAVFVGLYFLIESRYRIALWLLPVFVSFMVAIFLQAIIRRERPRAIKTAYKLMFNTYSFPSA